MFGRLRHRRNDDRWIVDRNLRAVPQRGFGGTVVDIVDPEYVGEKQRVELSALKDLRDLDPVIDIVV